MLPRFIPPCLPSRCEHAPLGDDWLHEIKVDGYRTQIRLEHGHARVFTRRGHDWTDEFGRIGPQAAKLAVDDAILDGEAVVLGPDGVSDFAALRSAIGTRTQHRIRFIAFDLLWLDGQDLRRRRLLDRKTVLRDLIPRDGPGWLLYADHLIGSGPTVFRQCEQFGVEGLVSKQVGSTYQSGRTQAWRKVKCAAWQETAADRFASF